MNNNLNKNIIMTLKEFKAILSDFDLETTHELREVLHDHKHHKCPKLVCNTCDNYKITLEKANKRINELSDEKDKLEKDYGERINNLTEILNNEDNSEKNKELEKEYNNKINKLSEKITKYNDFIINHETLVECNDIYFKQIKAYEEEINELKIMKKINYENLDIFNEYGVNGKDHLISILQIYNLVSYNHKFDFIKELCDIEHDIYMKKYELISIKKEIIKTKYIRSKCKNKVNDLLPILKNRTNIYKKLSKDSSELEKEFDAWYKLPICINCEDEFGPNNPRYDIKKYNLEKLCKKCIIKEVEVILRSKKNMKEIDKKYINNMVINKLLSKTYYDICFFNDIYKYNLRERIDLHDEQVLNYAGIEVKNEFDKYKLSNLCYRSNKLISLFSDRIDFINVSLWDLARMGKLEFEAFCNVLGEKVGYETVDDVVNTLSINNEKDPEPPSDWEEDEDEENDYIPQFDPDSDYDE